MHPERQYSNSPKEEESPPLLCLVALLLGHFPRKQWTRVLGFIKSEDLQTLEQMPHFPTELPNYQAMGNWSFYQVQREGTPKRDQVQLKPRDSRLQGLASLLRLGLIIIFGVRKAFHPMVRLVQTVRGLPSSIAGRAVLFLGPCEHI